MVDMSGATPIGTGAKTTRVAATTPAAAATPVATPKTGTGPDLSRAGGLAASLAATPPVDVDRVASIKRAIAEGRFPILPATIADRLLALKLQWNPNDKA